MCEGSTQAAADGLGLRKLEQQVADDPVLALFGPLERTVEDGRGFLEATRDGECPAALELERKVVGGAVEEPQCFVEASPLAQGGRTAAPGAEIARALSYLRVQPERLVVVADELAQVCEGERNLVFRAT